MQRTRAAYLGMIGSLSETDIKSRLLAMDLGELRIDDQLRRAALPTFCAYRDAAQKSRFSLAFRSAAGVDKPHSHRSRDPGYRGLTCVEPDAFAAACGKVTRPMPRMSPSPALNGSRTTSCSSV